MHLFSTRTYIEKGHESEKNFLVKDTKKDKLVLLGYMMNITQGKVSGKESCRSISHHKKNDLYMCKYRALYKPY